MTVQVDTQIVGLSWSRKVAGEPMANAVGRVELSLAEALRAATGPEAPPRLAAALHHAVFPGGARIRPRLCLAVAASCGDVNPDLADAAAAGIELLHCASLVHDDMPCFDDAAVRRGLASVHQAFGEDVALLAGDALIVLAFETLGHAVSPATLALLPRLLLILARASGAPAGIAAGQGWECEPQVNLARYQRAKTGALFAAATMAGAASCGAAPEPWGLLGERLGEAYQVADDIGDALSTVADLGKPIGRDLALGRPNAVLQLGVAGAVRRLQELVGEAAAVIPDCDNAAALRHLILAEAQRLLPKQMIEQAGLARVALRAA